MVVIIVSIHKITEKTLSPVFFWFGQLELLQWVISDSIPHTHLRPVLGVKQTFAEVIRPSTPPISTTF